MSAHLVASLRCHCGNAFALAEPGLMPCSSNTCLPNSGRPINGVGVGLNGLQVIAGILVIGASLASEAIIGTAFGGMLVLHGLNGLRTLCMAKPTA